MIQIGNYIFSLDVLEKNFKCNLSKCRGDCCLEGDAGAPLSKSEVELLKKIFDKVKPYLREEGIRAIEKQGTSVVDKDGDDVTALVDNRECAYSVFDGDVLLCGIENAWRDGAVEFQKPVSCHLFPIRVKKFRDITAVNYQELEICKSAVKCGQDEGVPVYKFLKEPIIRAFGEDVYNELCEAANYLNKRK